MRAWPSGPLRGATPITCDRTDAQKAPELPHAGHSTCVAAQGSGVPHAHQVVIGHSALGTRPAQEQIRQRCFNRTAGHSSPLPPCLADHLGATDMPIGCALAFPDPPQMTVGHHHGAKRRCPARGRASRSKTATKQMPIIAWAGAPPACGPAAAPCGRKTAPGSRRLTRLRPGTVLRSGMRVRAAARSGTVPDRP
jgi:hypothetical protein